MDVTCPGKKRLACLKNVDTPKRTADRSARSERGYSLARGGLLAFMPDRKLAPPASAGGSLVPTESHSCAGRYSVRFRATSFAFRSASRCLKAAIKPTFDHHLVAFPGAVRVLLNTLPSTPQHLGGSALLGRPFHHRAVTTPSSRRRLLVSRPGKLPAGPGVVPQGRADLVPRPAVSSPAALLPCSRRRRVEPASGPGCPGGSAASD